MNYQKEPPVEALEILKRRNIQFFDIDYYAWPGVFGSTSGPRGGLSGQAISNFTIEAYVCDGSGPTVFLCNGMYAFFDEPFTPFKQIKSWIPLPK